MTGAPQPFSFSGVIHRVIAVTKPDGTHTWMVFDYLNPCAASITFQALDAKGYRVKRTTISPRPSPKLEGAPS